MEWADQRVVALKSIASTTYMINSACYEPETNKTRLSLAGVPEDVEIEL